MKKTMIRFRCAFAAFALIVVVVLSNLLIPVLSAEDNDETMVIRRRLQACQKASDCGTINCIRAPCPQPICALNQCVIPECQTDSDCGTINCIRAPCPQPICRLNQCVIPECSSDSDCTLNCEFNKEQPCAKPICRTNKCVSKRNQKVCGKSYCGKNQYCCNASCSVCKLFGRGCTKQKCIDP